MVDSKENNKFDLGVKGLRRVAPFSPSPSPFHFSTSFTFKYNQSRA